MPTSIDAPTRSGYLLDGNLLIAFHDARHGQRDTVSEWVDAHKADSLFLCSVTEGTLLRFLMSPLFGARLAAPKAWDTLREFRARPNVLFLDAGFSYLDVQTQGLTGHKEVTDAWLVTLARRQGCRLATLDKGLVARHPDTTELLKS
jgi:toxin-antitoxin system PIN domain toxin